MGKVKPGDPSCLQYTVSVIALWGQGDRTTTAHSTKLVHWCAFPLHDYLTPICHSKCWSKLNFLVLQHTLQFHTQPSPQLSWFFSCVLTVWLTWCTGMFPENFWMWGFGVAFVAPPSPHPTLFFGTPSHGSHPLTSHLSSCFDFRWPESLSIPLQASVVHTPNIQKKKIYPMATVALFKQMCVFVCALISLSSVLATSWSVNSTKLRLGPSLSSNKICCACWTSWAFPG